LKKSGIVKDQDFKSKDIDFNSLSPEEKIELMKLGIQPGPDGKINVGSLNSS